MEIKEECLAYLGQYYKELFFGTANKRYRSMTGADLKHRLNRLSQETLNGVEKPNELNDIHAMFAKVCAYLMHKEERLKPGPALDQLKENWKKIIPAMMETGHTEEALKLMKSDIATSEILKDMLDEVDDVALKAYALDEIRRKKAIEQETK